MIAIYYKKVEKVLKFYIIFKFDIPTKLNSKVLLK